MKVQFVEEDAFVHQSKGFDGFMKLSHGQEYCIIKHEELFYFIATSKEELKEIFKCGLDWNECNQMSDLKAVSSEIGTIYLSRQYTLFQKSTFDDYLVCKSILNDCRFAHRTKQMECLFNELVISRQIIFCYL